MSDNLWEDLVEKDYNRTKMGLGMEINPDHSASKSASVASHYNSLQDRHRTLTDGSNIMHLRNLHNWIKSVLIGKYLRANDSVLEYVLILSASQSLD